ncbi:hypothetical protein TWF694_009296 [Orbilia ellipsospora]|uniref:Virilizer N-terminal domain-containing protein n=1 Tax=Orbilia ellipsospora TaxID=2528407 RepID=A0AAV9XFQ6_9PEZI
MECIKDAKTGKPVSSVLYEKPNENIAKHIINLLPLGALGVGQAINALAMVQKTMEEEGLGVRAAVIKTVILFGVTDQKITDEIWAAPPPPSFSSSSPNTRRLSPGEGRYSVSPPQTNTGHPVEAAKSSTPPPLPPSPQPSVPVEADVRDKYVPPHLRWMHKAKREENKKEEQEKKEEDKKEGERGERENKEEAEREEAEKEREEEEEEREREKKMKKDEKAQKEKCNAIMEPYVPPHLRYGSKLRSSM